MPLGMGEGSAMQRVMGMQDGSSQVSCRLP